ncbi:mas-related G-protein coupled receptor member H-like [Alligator mississippiensis]|uniref:mas-related G-protein coupled receptor member H-like n=1 Tax=Alligator mississippiensis TaxID=8496 RepID=UPI0009070A98|nr:mas-related G-protein coupled receptor member H-like [Alligator mississippiensis]
MSESNTQTNLYPTTDYEEYPQIDYTTLLIIDSITVFICLLGLVGNGIVLWFLSFCIKRNPFTTYIMNLAIADFGYLLCTTLFLFFENMYIFLFNLNIIRLIELFNMLVLFTYSISLHLLTAISTERCLSIQYPIWYQCHCPKHLSAIVCTLLWTLACLMAGLASPFCFLYSFETCIKMLTPLSATNLLVFSPIMVLSSIILFIKIRHSSQQQQPRKLYLVIMLTVLFFVFFAVPLSTVTFSQNYTYDPFLIDFSFLLASGNSSINPFIYFLVGSYRKRRFRGSVKVSFRTVFEEKVDPRDNTETARADRMVTGI